MSAANAGDGEGPDLQTLRAERDELQRAASALSARLRLSEFSRGHSLDEVLTRTLDEAERLTQSTIGFFHFVESDQKTLSLQTWSTNTLQNMCKAEGKGSHYAADKAGVWADALRLRRAVVHNDYAHLEHRKGLPAGHAPVSRELVVPILRSEAVVGILGVGNAERPYDDRDVEVVQLLASLAWDIVEAKRTEEALRRREALLRETQAFSHVGGWELDVASKRTTWTPEVRNLFEVDEFTNPGTYTPDCAVPADQQRLADALQRAVDHAEPFDFEVELVMPRGTRKWVRFAARAEEQNGRVVRVLGNVLDVTANRRLQASLALNDRLSSMGMLAAGVGHELNNPLAYVLANVDTLALELPRVLGAARRCASALRYALGEDAWRAAIGDDDALSPLLLDDLVECANTALEGTRRIQSVSRRLGAFARIERNKLEPIDVHLPLEGALTLVHNEVKFRAALVRDFGVLPRLVAPESKLSQVFLNLLTNAAQAIPEGRVADNRITVRTWAEGASVFIEVADTGAGIPLENLERIFEPFFTTNRAGGASGLGLSISRNIVTELGGELTVKSELGRGSRFTVRLPAVPQPKRAERPPSPAAPVRRGRLLVIDDEEQIRKSIARILGRDFDVVVAASGRAALELVAQDQAFEAVLCDLMMPEVTGMQVFDWLTANAPALAQRVLFVTGGGFTRNATDFLERVPNPRLEKPFAPNDLRAAVDRLLGPPP